MTGAVVEVGQAQGCEPCQCVGGGIGGDMKFQGQLERIGDDAPAAENGCCYCFVEEGGEGTAPSKATIAASERICQDRTMRGWAAMFSSATR